MIAEVITLSMRHSHRVSSAVTAEVSAAASTLNCRKVKSCVSIGKSASEVKGSVKMSNKGELRRINIMHDVEPQRKHSGALDAEAWWYYIPL